MSDLKYQDFELGYYKAVKDIILNTNTLYGMFDTSEVFDYLEVFILEHMGEDNTLLDLIEKERTK